MVEINKKDGLWQTIVGQKYMRNMDIFFVKMRAFDSPCWKNLLKLKDIYLSGWKVPLKKGNPMRFLERSLAKHYFLVCELPYAFLTYLCPQM
jgi:hypothetical protein